MAASAETLIIIRAQHLGMIISDSESLFNFSSTSVFAGLVDHLDLPVDLRDDHRWRENREPSGKTSREVCAGVGYNYELR